MFLRWISVQGLLPIEVGSDPLAPFDPETRRKVCKLLLQDVTENERRLAAATESEPQLIWLLAVMGHALTLPFGKEHAVSTTETMGKTLQM